jgi:hypothetical protein
MRIVDHGLIALDHQPTGLKELRQEPGCLFRLRAELLGR